MTTTVEHAHVLHEEAVRSGCADAALDDCLEIAAMWHHHSLPLDTPADRLFAVSEIKAMSVRRRATMSVTATDNEPPLPIFAGATPPDFDTTATEDAFTAIRVWEHATGDGVWVRVLDSYDTRSSRLDRRPPMVTFDNDVAETAEETLALASALMVAARILRGGVA